MTLFPVPGPALDQEDVLRSAARLLQSRGDLVERLALLVDQVVAGSSFENLAEDLLERGTRDDAALRAPLGRLRRGAAVVRGGEVSQQVFAQ